MRETKISVRLLLLIVVILFFCIVVLSVQLQKGNAKLSDIEKTTEELKSIAHEFKEEAANQEEFDDEIREAIRIVKRIEAVVNELKKEVVGL